MDFESAGKKIHLRMIGPAFHILIEISQIRILFMGFKKWHITQPVTKDFHKRGLA